MCYSHSCRETPVSLREELRICYSDEVMRQGFVDASANLHEKEVDIPSDKYTRTYVELNLTTSPSSYSPELIRIVGREKEGQCDKEKTCSCSYLSQRLSHSSSPWSPRSCFVSESPEMSLLDKASASLFTAAFKWPVVRPGWHKSREGELKAL